MSIPKRTTISCPKCGKEFEVTVFQSINTDYAPNIAESIISGELFEAKCPACGFITHLEYDVLYHDMEHAAMVWVVNPKQSSYETRCNEMRSAPIPPYKVTRHVPNINGLREKTACLEAGRDDRIIEIIKIFVESQTSEENPDFHLDASFYTYSKGQEIVYVYDTDGNELRCNITDQMYHTVATQFKGQISSEEGRFADINHEWAMQQIRVYSQSHNTNVAKQESIPSSVEETRNTCPHCGKSIPEDSMFCQFCGKSIEIAPLPQPELSHNDQFVQSSAPANVESSDSPSMRILREEFLEEVTENFPLVVNSVALLQPIDSDDVILRCSFTSLSPVKITALLIEVECYDIWGSLIGTMSNVQYLELEGICGAHFGSHKQIKVFDSNTRRVEINLKKAMLDDGTVLDCAGEKRRLGVPKVLAEYFSSSELVQQYARMTTAQSKWIPVQIDDLWRCACGTINTHDIIVCNSCGQEKEKIFNLLDEEKIRAELEIHYESERLAAEQLRRQQEELERLAHEEQERLQKEREEQARIEREKLEQIQKKQEAERIAKVQQERELAIQNAKAQVAAEKKRKNIVKAIVAIVLVILVGLFIYHEIQDEAYHSQVRNMATDEMGERFKNMYADVVSIDPYYFIYEYKTSSSGVRKSPDQLMYVVCKCKTVEGKYIWARFYHSDYPGADYDTKEEEFQKKTYSKSSPLHLTGTTFTAKSTMSELGKKLGDVFVLHVHIEEK